MYVCNICAGERLSYMDQHTNSLDGDEHSIERRNVFSDVMDLYKAGEIVNECPIFIKFKGENAIDNGGVQRDMISSFWEVAYQRLFEGAALLTPMVHPQMDLSIFPIIGCILSHGYLTTGILPVRVALPTLICMLLGPAASVSKKLLLETLVDFISAEERKVIKQALAHTNSGAYPNDLQNDLEDILATYGVRVLPKPSTLPKIIEQVAYYQFINKPAAAIALINSGIPVIHRNFWMDKSPDYIAELHKHLTVTPAKMLQFLRLPDAHTPQQQQVCSYLRTMIGNLNKDKLRLLMRFITGSCVCTTNKIVVAFNGLQGFARRPLAYTCDCLLQLPTAYVNYDDFYSDFRSILQQTHDEFSWRMDGL